MQQWLIASMPVTTANSTSANSPTYHAEGYAIGKLHVHDCVHVNISVCQPGMHTELKHSYQLTDLQKKFMFIANRHSLCSTMPTTGVQQTSIRNSAQKSICARERAHLINKDNAPARQDLHQEHCNQSTKQAVVQDAQPWLLLQCFASSCMPQNLLSCTMQDASASASNQVMRCWVDIYTAHTADIIDERHLELRIEAG